MTPQLAVALASREHPAKWSKPSVMCRETYSGFQHLYASSPALRCVGKSLADFWRGKGCTRNSGLPRIHSCGSMPTLQVRSVSALALVRNTPRWTRGPQLDTSLCTLPLMAFKYAHCCVGECVLCLPLIHRVVVEYNEKVLILVTVRSEDALELLRSSLPDRVLLLRAPHDTPFAVNRFLEHWRPCIGVMMSAWLAPNLVVMSAQVRCKPLYMYVCTISCSTVNCSLRLVAAWLQAGIPLALMDGSIPAHIFHFWHHIRPMRTLWRAMASCFQLIIPHSDIEVGRFRLMGASLSQMPGWCNDLSYACSLSATVANLWRPPVAQISALEALLASRSAWMACHVHPSDEPQLQHVHMQLRTEFPSLLTVYIYHGSDTGACLAAEWAAAGVPSVCSSSWPASCTLFTITCSNPSCFRHKLQW